MKKYLLSGFIIFCLSFAGTAGILLAQPAEPVHAGVAAAVKGEVRAISQGATARDLKSGEKIFMGDQIETGADGQLQVLLLDQTVFTLGSLSAVTIDEFIYEPASGDGKVKASMMKGIFRVVSGLVAHKKPENMNVNLPAGTIGFRGTHVAGIIEGQRTLVVLMSPTGSGSVFVSNVVDGEVKGVDIRETGKATIIQGPNTAPWPAFQVPEADLNRIAQALAQPITPPSSGTAPTTGVADTTSVADTTRAAETQDTGRDQNGASTAVTQSVEKLISTLNDIDQQTQTAAEDVAKATGSAQAEHTSQSSQGEGQHTVEG